MYGTKEQASKAREAQMKEGKKESEEFETVETKTYSDII